MRIPRKRLLLALTCVGLCGCASIGPPLPPSLELPKPPSDLRAARKGDKVTLTWTIPQRTTDRQSVRYLGKTRICRSLDPVVKECGKPVGEAEPPPNFTSARKGAKKLTATFVDTLPKALEESHPADFATYAVEVLNTADRSAGLSNQVHVPLVPTLPPVSDFSAQLTAQGISLSWHCPRIVNAAAPWTTYLLRIYRRSESSTNQARIAEVDVTGCVVNLPG
jgi:hypothetical protein